MLFLYHIYKFESYNRIPRFSKLENLLKTEYLYIWCIDQFKNLFLIYRLLKLHRVLYYKFSNTFVIYYYYLYIEYSLFVVIIKEEYNCIEVIKF